MHLLYSLKHIKLHLLSFKHNVLIFTVNFIHYKFINDKIQIIYGYIKNTWIMYNLTNNCNNLFIKDRNFFQHIFLSRVGTFLYILILLKRNIKNIIIGANFRKSLRPSSKCICCNLQYISLCLLIQTHRLPDQWHLKTVNIHM